GSLAENQSGYVCMIDDPNPKQCDNFCRTELLRLLKEDARVHGPEDTCDAGNRAKLESVADKQAKLEGQLHGVEAKLKGHHQEMQAKLEAKLEKSLHEVKTKLEGRLQGVEAKLEGQQTNMEAKLGESLLAVQEKIENQLQAVVNQLQAVSNKIDAAKVEIPDFVRIVPSGFERIGNRYFRIVNEREDWYTAKRRCREMGGYLASFRNELEFNAITPKLGDYVYWLGINDQEKEGHFESVASHKPAPFLKWHEEEPNDKNHLDNYVYLHNGRMGDNVSNAVWFFICQADNEI
ncbi:hypothetical protein KR059_003435, partial [Drosophila kikkawai]